MDKQSDAVFTAGEMLKQPEDVKETEIEVEEQPDAEETAQETEQETTTEEKPKQSPDADKIAKQAREYAKRVEKRAEEAQQRAREEAEKRLKAERASARLLEALGTYGYGGNGESAEDVAAAVIAAQRGLDAETVKRQYEQADKQAQEAIDNDPRVQAALEFEQRQLAALQMQNDLNAIKAEFPSETAARLEDIRNVARYTEYIQKGYEAVDAYFLANRDEISRKPKAKTNDKEHLIPAGGTAGGDGGKEIPASELATWKEAFPDETAAQLRVRYNKYLKL